MTEFQIAILCAALAAALIIAAALFCYLSNWWLKITRYKIKAKGAPKLKIAHLSDLHARNFGKNNKKLVAKLKAEQPDFIVITGDIIHKYRPRDIAVAEYTVKALCEVAPVYYVSGNHEMRSLKWRSLKQRMGDCGAVVLDDSVVFAFGVSLVGVNCANLKNAVPFKLAEGAQGFKILLAHKPEFIDRYALAGYDLVLCGHAHGGQWRLPFTDIGFYSPGQGLFPKLTCGVHSRGDMRQVISRGLGNSQCPLRIFNRPEAVIVELENNQ